MQQVAVAPQQVWYVCIMKGHDGLEKANALGGFQGQLKQKYDPYSNTYNKVWHDHPNLKWNNQNNVRQVVFPLHL